MNNTLSKLNTLFLGIIAAALIVIMIDSLKPRYVPNTTNFLLDSKTGKIYYHENGGLKEMKAIAADTLN
jgi:hypothetical protein